MRWGIAKLKREPWVDFELNEKQKGKEIHKKWETENKRKKKKKAKDKEI